MKEKMIFAIAIGMFTANCASLPPRNEMQAAVANFELPAKADKNRALVYVLRPGGVGGMIAFNVFLDNEEPKSEMGYNRGSGYIYFYVNPGQHKLFSKAENTAEIEINAAAGMVYFIRQDASMGLIMARNNLVAIDDLEGKYHLKSLQPGEILRKE